MTYKDKLLDPRWQKKRLEVLERDDFSCRYCFSNSKTLHVHHILYEKGNEPWEYDLSNFLSLCENCHLDVSPRIKKIGNEIIRHINQKLCFEYSLQNVLNVINRMPPEQLCHLFHTYSDPLISEEEIYDQILSLNSLRGYRETELIKERSLNKKNKVICQE